MTQQYMNGAGGGGTPNGQHPETRSRKGRRRGQPQEEAPAPPSVAVEFAPPPRNPPAAVFQTGAVETCVWSNPGTDPVQPCVWTVTQSRLYPLGGGAGHAWSLRAADLDAARWGLVLARRWIRRAERRGALRSLFGR